jgi:alkylation response protein AidB-like acyl-CoA dehydrogenase
VAERGVPGFARVPVPATNLLGRVGCGFVHLMERLPPERLSTGMMALASVRAALDWTVDYVTQRTALGRPWPRSRTPSSSWPPR